MNNSIEKAVMQGGAEEEGKVDTVEMLTAMPQEQIREMAEAMMTPEEKATCTEADFEAITQVAKKYLERRRAQTLHDAIEMGKIAVVDVGKLTGKATVFARDVEGNIIAGGSSAAEAMKKANDVTKEG